jgi:hypothetical protein
MGEALFDELYFLSIKSAPLESLVVLNCQLLFYSSFRTTKTLLE